MPRQLRIEYPGAFYHVMSRGDRREDIFLDDGDREMWGVTWAQACERARMRTHAWVLMSNHFHVLLETPDGNLVDGMRWFLTTYTARFNRRHRLTGHLFQGRCKAVIADPDEPGTLLRIADYIHLNPARAKLLNKREPDLGDHLWGSHRMYAGLDSGVDRPWFEPGRIWRSLTLDREPETSRHQAYVARMKARVAEVLDRSNRDKLAEEWRELRRGWCLGGREFRDRLDRSMKKVLRAAKAESHAGPAREEAEIRRAEDVLARGCQTLGVSLEDIRGRQAVDPVKETLVWLLKSKTTRSNAWISARLNMGHTSAVTRAARNTRLGSTEKHRVAHATFIGLSD